MTGLIDALRGPWPAGLAVLMATGLLGVQAGPLVWLATGHGPSSPVHAPAPEPTHDRLEPGAGVAAFAETDPFGAYVAPGSRSAPMAETGLGLVLVGVVVAEPKANSRAFIERDGELGSHRPGETITSGVRLHEVRPGRVVLEVEGALETLSLPEPETGDAMGRSPAGSRGAAAIRARLSPSARSSTAGAGDGGTGPASQSSASAQAVIDQYRRRIDENPQAVLDSLALEAGEAGYRVAEDPPEAVRRAGLRPGDVVTRVNGRTVGDVERDRRLYDQIAAEGRARIEVRRGERTLTLTFPLQ